MHVFHGTFRDLLHAVRHGTDGFTSHPKEGALRIFFALKNPTASAGFEPANLDTKGQRATSRPPKPLWGDMDWIDLALVRDSSWALVIAVMDLLVPYYAGNLLTSLEPVSL